MDFTNEPTSWEVSRLAAQNVLQHLDETRAREKRDLVSLLQEARTRLKREQEWNQQLVTRCLHLEARVKKCARLEERVAELEKDNAIHVARRTSLRLHILGLQRLKRARHASTLAPPEGVMMAVEANMSPRDSAQGVERNMPFARTGFATHDASMRNQHAVPGSAASQGGMAFGSHPSNFVDDDPVSRGTVERALRRSISDFVDEPSIPDGSCVDDQAGRTNGVVLSPEQRERIRARLLCGRGPNRTIRGEASVCQEESVSVTGSVVDAPSPTPTGYTSRILLSGEAHQAVECSGMCSNFTCRATVSVFCSVIPRCVNAVRACWGSVFSLPRQYGGICFAHR